MDPGQLSRLFPFPFQPTQMVNTVAPTPGGIQIVQQIIGPNGEIQQIPIQLTNQQLQLIRAQMSGTHRSEFFRVRFFMVKIPDFFWFG